ncbi:hypothetical protein S40293_10205 [Stachybotrys chartarum IBT 40293]|nr:hypothetical protein S40293_10205 [Stachybotrys chartarum IBT 40293]
MWSKTISFVSVLGLAVSQVSATCPPDLRAILLDSDLNWSEGTTITFPEDGADFAAVTGRWSIYSSPTFAAAVSPATEEDVMLAVRLARRHNINFLATGGRHSVVDTLEELQQGLAIDLHQFDSIHVDQAAARLTIGGGVRTHDIYEPVTQAGLEIPVGSCSCTGMVGVTLGGGANAWISSRGMISDSLLSVRLITAEGELTNVSETENSELFWALRGAGANFGIVTSATYQLHSPTYDNRALTVDLLFPPQVNVSYYTALETMARNQPYELAATTMVLYNQTLGLPLIVGSFVYFGPEDDGMAALQPLMDLHPIVTSIHRDVAWDELPATILLGSDAQICIPGSIHNTWGAYSRAISGTNMIRAFSDMAQFYRGYPSARGSVIVYRHHGHGPGDDIPSNYTAFPWRDSRAGMEVNLIYAPGNATVEAAADTVAGRIRTEFVESSGYESLAVHVNLARAADSLESIYGADKLPTLAALKNTWDPDNVFRWHHGLPTSYP